MIKYYLVTGDLHGRLGRVQQIHTNPEETAIIILGDAGFQYYLDSRDTKFKNEAKHTGFTFYCVRGNHEARPADIKNIIYEYDDNVKGMVYYEPDFPTIRYFSDGGEYTILGKKTLVIGGAYSVDKQYRLLRGWQWFANEQLSKEEQKEIEQFLITQYPDTPHYDLVLTHTCPLSWEPRELFLSMIDQSTVDASTEIWLEEIKNKITYDFWLFGHFHGNKIVNSNAAMLFEAVLDIGTIEPIDLETFEIPEGFYMTE